MTINVNLTGQGLELTDALRGFVNEKFSRLNRHSDQITAVHVVLSTENKRQTADATIHISHAKDIHAEATAEDMYVSIDNVADKIERMLVKQKGKNLDSQRQHKDKEVLFETEEE